VSQPKAYHPGRPASIFLQVFKWLCLSKCHSSLTRNTLEPADSLRVRPLAFSRMLSNLLENSRRYAGGATEVRASLKGGRYVLRLMDRGPGIESEKLAEVFQPFVHGGKGSGLGLVVARRITRLHGGELSLHPRFGGGLEARVDLPV